MRFEHEGRSLWYGTADTPAPEQAQAGAETLITVGVWPVDPSNRVELLYRVNQGPIKTVTANWLRNDPSGKAQYFRLSLPGFHAGDTVEYIPFCGCAGRQVPSPDEASRFVSSFHVTEMEVKPALNVAGRDLNLRTPERQAVRAESASPLMPVSKYAIGSSRPKPLAAGKDVTPDTRAEKTAQVKALPDGPSSRKAGELPHTDVPPKRNPHSVEPAARIEAIKRVVGKAGIFLEKNSGLDLRFADFHKGAYFKRGENEPSPIQWDSIGKEQPQVLAQLKAFQRVLRIHPEPEIAERLLARGFDSARRIADHSEARFLALWDGDEAEGRAIYRRAGEVSERAALLALSARDTAGSRLGRGSFFDNAGADLVDYFQSIPGFNELFALPTFCACDHCKSMFGPAAYIVDLMRFVDINITEPNRGIRVGLTLKDRRPDLWQIPLDCQNATHEVPYLDIVNEVFEQRITRAYAIADPYQALLVERHPLDLPFNLPLERTRTYLGHFGKPLHEIFRTFESGARDVAMESLGLSQEEFEIITTSNTNDQYLRTVYGVSAPGPGPTLVIGGNFWRELTRVDRFLLHSGLSRKELNRLLFQNLDKAEQPTDLQHFFFINNVHPAALVIGPVHQPSLAIEAVDADPADVHEELRNLSNEKLDRIHRFVRLARKLGWSFEDLDWALRALGKTAPDKDIDEDAIIKLAKAKEWQERFKVPVDVLCALWYDIKDIGRFNPEGKEPHDLFNRTFNNPDVLGGNAPYTFNPLRFLQPNDRRDHNRGWLLAALEISEAELDMLLQGPPTAPLALSKPVISSLYRLSRLPKMLGLWTRDFLELLKLLGINDLDRLRAFAVLEQVIDAAEWVLGAGFNVHELQALRRKSSNQFVALTDPEENARLLCEQLAAATAANVMLVSDLTAIDGVTPALADVLFDDLVNNGFIAKESPDDRHGRLTDKFRPSAAGFTLQPLLAPFDVAAEEQRLIQALESHDPKQIVLDRLSAFLRMDPLLVSRIIVASGNSLDEANLFGWLTTRIDPGAPVPQGLTVFLSAMGAYQLLLREVKLEPDEIAHVTANPQNYNIQSIGNLSFTNVRRLHRFAQLARSLTDPAALRGFFDTGDRDAKIDALSAILHRDAAQVRVVVDAGWPIQPLVADTRFANAEGVAKIKERLDLATYFGVSVETLLSWAAWNNGGWNEYQRIADFALETLKAKYGEKEWRKRYDPLHDDIRERKRDALASFIMARERGHGIKSLKDLYKYFLLDVETTSCARISRIAQAILSVQLYIQRCQLSLERDVDPVGIPLAEWRWMKNYRVWEANRKVFLYPENYILPELRDDKTPIFRDLEDELVQGELTAFTAENAYRNYLNKFAEIANLKIAGSYYDAVTSTLFLIGRTKTEPRSYYYRKCVNEVTWTPWEKIELTIKADVASPIFAFNRLFVFWVERRKGNPDDPAEQGLKGVIKYSYYDFRGRWAQPQTLTKRVFNLVVISDPPTHVLTESHIDKAYNSLVYPYKQPKFIRVATYDRYTRYAVPTYLFYDLREVSDLSVPLNNPPTPFSVLAIDRHRDLNRDRAKLVEVSAGSYREEDYYFGGTWVANVEDIALTRPNFINDVLGEIPYLGSEIKIVNNQPQWFVFDGDVEEFLVKKQLDPQYQDLLDAGLDPAGGPYRFYFERITTDTVHEMSQRLFAGGVDGLLSVDSQMLPELPFNEYNPTTAAGYPVANLDFRGAYAQYFAEIFFHIPFLIANQLNAAQRFEDAQKWYHYIFNPTIADAEPGVAARDRWWRYVPFRNQHLPAFQDMLTDPAALAAYRDNPFQPHTIARLRLGVYQKTVVMKYIDNLIDWAEVRFAENRWESITEATLLYLLAWEILGGRPPEELDPCATPPTQTYQNLADVYRAGSNIPEFWIEVENAPIGPNVPIIRRIEDLPGNARPRTDSLLYFCFSDNKDLRDYWTRVQSGLYNIRHCLTIAGVKSDRPLYDPPIDPMVLVRAAAGGRDIGSVLAEVFRPISHYRFAYFLEKARGLAAQVQQLGSVFLSALKKQDAEQFALLRSTHEQNIMKLTRTVKEQQEAEAVENHAALVENRKNAVTRSKHYQALFAASYIPNETVYFSKIETARDFETAASIGRVGAAVARLIVLKITDGQDIGPALDYAAGALSSIAGHYSLVASIHSAKAGFIRRAEDWKLQQQLAKHDVDQLDRLVEAAGIRKEIATIDLQTQDKTIEQAEEQELFLKDKFTNRELYQWMTGQLAGVYFQSYRLAYDLAKAAERSFQFERNTTDTYINFGHWDSLKKGLLAGEMLMLELNQLEKAYLDANSRSLEIERTIPLSQLADDTPGSPYPTALIALKETGACEFTLSNTLFEQDYPGHYCRQIKNLSLSIPAIVGPYEHLKATLTQTSNSILIRPDTNALLVSAAGDAVELDPNSINVRTAWRSHQQIAISSGVNDSGQFQLNFGDERYLPFEGTGARSSWELEIPKRTNTVDLYTVSDVLVHLRYTARFDGSLRQFVENALTKERGYTFLSLRPEQSTGWHRFLNPNSGVQEHELRFSITPALLPPNASQYRIEEILLKCDLASVALPLVADLTVALKPGSADLMNLVLRLSAVDSGVPANGSAFGEWRMTIDRRAIPPELRRKRSDGTTMVEDIGGNSHYLLDPDKLQNLQLVLIHTGVLRA